MCKYCEEITKYKMDDGKGHKETMVCRYDGETLDDAMVYILDTTTKDKSMLYVWLSDTDVNINHVYIPIKYCPICGRKLV